MMNNSVKEKAEDNHKLAENIISFFYKDSQELEEKQKVNFKSFELIK